MSNRASFVVTACALALGASAVLAQTPQTAAAGAAKPGGATTVSPVTVEAATPKVIQKQTWSFVEAYAAAAPKLDLIARWHEPICVKVVNLTPEQAAMVQGRVEEVARGVGLPVGKPGCESNIQIVLTSQPQAFVDKVAKADEHALGFHYPSQLNKVKTVSHSVQGWYKTATQGGKIGHDGLPFAPLKSPIAAKTAYEDGGRPNPGNLAGETQAPETLDIAENGSPPGCAGSLISDCTRSAFKNVLVVVDVHAVEGKSLGAVADYVAMLALSQVKPADGCSPMPSILDLLAKSACAGRGDMASRMAEMLIKAKEPTRVAK